jgi:hypothetical protein
MKKLIYILVLAVSVGSLAANDGKGCNMKKTAKTVELTGQLVCKGTGEDCAPVFRVANSNTTYHVCDESKVDVNALAKDTKATFRVTGKLVNCTEGEELVIEKASKI